MFTYPFFLFPTVTLVSLSTFLDIRVEDVSNLGGGWKIQTSVSHGSIKKERKTRVSENRGDNLKDVVRKAPRAKSVDVGETDVGG